MSNKTGVQPVSRIAQCGLVFVKMVNGLERGKEGGGGWLTKNWWHIPPHNKRDDKFTKSNRAKLQKTKPA
jgi:hypothetical protein